MLNFRKLKQDFSSNIVKEGRDLYENQKVVSAKLVHLDSKTMRITSRILGQYENHYESQIEIDRTECVTIDSDCDCPYNYDCQHLAALLFYLEVHLDEILVAYSKEADFGKNDDIDEEEREELLVKFKEAETKEVQRQEELYQKQLLQEYVTSSEILSVSPFFRAPEKNQIDRAEFALIFALPNNHDGEAKGPIEIQVALRLPFRSKPLHIPQIKAFFESLRYEEPIFIGGRRYCFSVQSFDQAQKEIVSLVRDHVRFQENPSSERWQRIAQIDAEIFGMILARTYEIASEQLASLGFSHQDEELPILPGLYEGSMEVPLRFSTSPAGLQFILEYIGPPTSKMLINTMILIDQQAIVIEEARLFECAKPGMLFKNAYYRFPAHITRLHLRNLKPIRDMTIPEPLFGTFVENSLPELSRFAEVANQHVIEQFVTLPFVGNVEAKCDLSFLNGELEAILHFHYDGHNIPAASAYLTYEDLSSFVSPQGILARNLVEERRIIEDIFQDFVYNAEQGVYIAKSDKKIVEFMTDVIPRNQHRVTFNCPQNLLDQFIYDQTKFKLHMNHTSRIDVYEIELQVDGALKGVRMDLLWECMASKKAFIELDTPKFKKKKGTEGGKLSKILVLDLDRISGVIQLFDELGIEVLDDHKLERPLWSLASIEAAHFEGLPVEFSISEKLVDIRKQMIGEKHLTFSPIPETIKATLRTYQGDGVKWLERLRSMYLNGILADDMGLGKTLQAIVAITQHQKKPRHVSLIVCPTSLLYNWKEEFNKFNPKLKVVVVDGIPNNRKKLIDSIDEYDVIITSYTLLQKDIDCYKMTPFSYVILDEAQHIKNRGTRNAKSVKMIQAEHRLILSGTPIENSLDELWSLFDFLMPGFLSSYDRFIEKYVRISGSEQTKNLEYLRKKVSPFILRRMKSDVLDDLPPVSEIVYHCQLSEVQQELYRSYAESARDELVKLVQRDGFDRVQIHVLATLTRLKQICCHPAIFAKEKPESGDSAKYDMLVDLLQTLVEGKHKTVIFSQYTRMLQIMREDFEQKGIRFLYLDGSSKNRLEVVKQFNEDESVSVFLVSLKAGGTGLNLVGADTVIHYDMWWNPAVESQATDRVHRLGQKNSVSSYKLITLGTIEEKIAEMQKRKKGLVKKVVSCDDEAISKLTWEDVLELLKT
ncbi:MAG TPA: DEAD/DEAH box helicase [Rhabdochlamydiaceae bacterium]|nr:DEAD/DEAH box helicase [Rhabdochlamydiaceae bacterium]